jgi:hypothetical protein
MAAEIVVIHVAVAAEATQEQRHGRAGADVVF